MATDKAQVVFMVDTSLTGSAKGSLEQHYRSLCLATVRILLYLSQFPIREHLNRVLWNFKLFNSERAEKSAKTWQFHENRSEHIDRFFQQLHESLEQSEVLQHNQAMPDSLMSRIRHKNLSDLYTVHLQLSFKTSYGMPLTLCHQLGRGNEGEWCGPKQLLLPQA